MSILILISKCTLANKAGKCKQWDEAQKLLSNILFNFIYCTYVQFILSIGVLSGDGPGGIVPPQWNWKVIEI